MRRLDQLLTAASDRGERTGAEALIEHLERRLHGEREQVVAAPPRRTAMVAIETRPTTPTEPPPRRRKRWAYALAAFAVVAGAVAVTLAMLGSGGGEEIADEMTQARAIELVQEFAANVRNNDIESLSAGAATPADVGMVEWMYGMRTDPEFSNCRVSRESVNGFTVLCDVTFAPDSFLARAAGGTTTTAIEVFPTGLVSVVSWPPPAGLGETALELRTFFDARHPDLTDTVFGLSGYAGMAWTQEAGETIAQHLDEFIAWRDSPTASVTPTEVMARLATAIESVDSQIDEPIAADTDPMEDRGFLAWNTALGLDPEFSGCEETSAFSSSSTFRCDVTMGDGYFFSVIAAENLPTSVSATVGMNGSLSAQSWPPPQGLVTMENEFRDWVRATHPELEDRMFGTDYGGVVRFSREAGELHMQYLEEYLSYLAAG